MACTCWGIKTSLGNLVSKFYLTENEAYKYLIKYLSLIDELPSLTSWKVVKVKIEEVEEK